MPTTGRRWGGSVLAGVLLLAACGSSEARTNGASGSAGISSEDVAGGRLDALPSGPLFMRVNSFNQPADSEIGSKKHQPGFVYQIAGEQELGFANGSVKIVPGEGYFVQSIEHTHRNAGTSPNDWVFVALWPSEVRTQPNVSTAQVVYESEDISPTGLQTGPYAETLQVVTLQPNGHTGFRERSGLQTLFVLSGSLRVRTGATSMLLGPNSGTYLAPHTRYQELAVGNTPVKLLDFTVTPVGQPFEEQPSRL